MRCKLSQEEGSSAAPKLAPGGGKFAGFSIRTKRMPMKWTRMFPRIHASKDCTRQVVPVPDQGGSGGCIWVGRTNGNGAGTIG
jgi:hypothetical protein